MLSVLSLPYGLAVRTRSMMYERGWWSQQRLPCPVLSVGNLTVGGTGKTPMVMWLSRWFSERGRRVGILSRGYRRSRRNSFLLVSDGDNVLVSPGEAGDEPFLMARQCPGVVVAVGSNRYRLGQWVLEQTPVDCFVLDDGFQHRNLCRDLDLLLIDTSTPESLHHLLPAGKLREPLSCAARATAVVLTRVDMAQDWRNVLTLLEDAIGEVIHPISTRFQAVSLVDARTEVVREPNGIAGKRALIFSGIGNARSFHTIVAGLHVQILDEIVFPDHHAYRRRDLITVRRKRMQCGADLVLTTEKDAVKIAPLLESGDEIQAVRLGIQFVDGQDQLEGHLLAMDHIIGCRGVK